MADSHYLIEKSVVDGFSKTSIRLLSREDITEELSRMLGGTEITDIVRQNAIQMKSMADEMKKLSV
jgi:DNA repair protein RecN (Recombination protein N)